MDAAYAIFLFSGHKNVNTQIRKYTNTQMQIHSKRHYKGGGMDGADAILLFTGDNPAGRVFTVQLRGQTSIEMSAHPKLDQRSISVFPRLAQEFLTLDPSDLL